MDSTPNHQKTFDVTRLPRPASPQEAANCWERWNTQAAKTADSQLADAMRRCHADSATNALLTALFGNSPFLAHLALRYPEVITRFATGGPDAAYAEIVSELHSSSVSTLGVPQLSPLLRHLRAKIALLTAAADIAGLWALTEVTRTLSEFADRALSCSIDVLLVQAAQRAEIMLPNPQAPSEGSGLIVLGMGKLGAKELNYSSDIDLILFYEPGCLNYSGRHTEQKFFNRLSHDLVQLMQERTPEGYVFRTDLRLRPDPASTPPAITTSAAITYYESVGQNWERAAMIKARPVAGDLKAGEALLTMLAPFMWRRNLDFAAIQDIHSIKRQMDSRDPREVQIPSHNVKVGLGGIREIEFFTQIHQLIWGGREPSLRLHGTCETLAQLTRLGLVDSATAATLTSAYTLLRNIEHRLQMINDQQTHEIPEALEELQRACIFMGYASPEALSADLLPVLHTVHGIFSSSFREAEKLGDEGNLVFTGVSHDPDTLDTLTGMGYKYPDRVSEAVMGWHHGSRRCTRTKRARELLTELMPSLLKRLSQTADPDAAFLKFDEFLIRVPVGAQLFTLFTAHPPLLGLIADILGSAPVLADTLSRHPDLLDSVLYGDFYGALPTRGALSAQLKDLLAYTPDFEQRMEMLRRFKNEKQFQAGVQLLQQVADARTSGQYLALLAEVILEEALAAVQAEFEQAYGRMPGGRFAVIALGRLGSCEMTFGSDIDLTFIYDVPHEEAMSDGAKGLPASVYYNRMAQRLHSALNGMGREGRLYETDTRLQPSGTHGLSAVTIGALEHYFDALAWTFEFMALTKARAIAGDAGLMQLLDALIALQLCKPRDAAQLKTDVATMRERVAREFPPSNPWDLKHAHGGLMDLDFLAQFLLLKHAHAHPQILARSCREQIEHLHKAGLLGTQEAEELQYALNFLESLLHMMRLSAGGQLDEAAAQPGLKGLLASATGATDFAVLKNTLLEVEKTVQKHYIAVIGAH